MKCLSMGLFFFSRVFNYSELLMCYSCTWVALNLCWAAIVRLVGKWDYFSCFFLFVLFYFILSNLFSFFSLYLYFERQVTSYSQWWLMASMYIMCPSLNFYAFFFSFLLFSCICILFFFFFRYFFSFCFAWME